jgi:hypothetical protein
MHGFKRQQNEKNKYIFRACHPGFNGCKSQTPRPCERSKLCAVDSETLRYLQQVGLWSTDCFASLARTFGTNWQLFQVYTDNTSEKLQQ